MNDNWILEGSFVLFVSAPNQEFVVTSYIESLNKLESPLTPYPYTDKTPVLSKLLLSQVALSIAGISQPIFLSTISIRLKLNIFCGISPDSVVDSVASVPSS